MSKSTPIAQLPFQQSGSSSAQPSVPTAAQQQFVNDQHRQIVASAQNAAQNYTMPQPSSPHEAYGDDDATIQEALQSFSQPQQQQQSQHMLHMPPSPQPPSPHQVHAMAAAVQPPQMQQMQHPMQQQLPQQQQQQPAPYSGQPGLSWMPDHDDARLLLLGVLAFVIVSVLPVASLVAQYVPIDVPYADVMIKAAVMAALMYVGKRVVGKSI